MKNMKMGLPATCQQNCYRQTPGFYPDFTVTCRAHLWTHCVDSFDHLKNPKRNAIGENQGTMDTHDPILNMLCTSFTHVRTAPSLAPRHRNPPFSITTPSLASLRCPPRICICKLRAHGPGNRENFPVAAPLSLLIGCRNVNISRSSVTLFVGQRKNVKLW